MGWSRGTRYGECRLVENPSLRTTDDKVVWTLCLIFFVNVSWAWVNVNKNHRELKVWSCIWVNVNVGSMTKKISWCLLRKSWAESNSVKGHKICQECIRISGKWEGEFWTLVKSFHHLASTLQWCMSYHCHSSKVLIVFFLLPYLLTALLWSLLDLTNLFGCWHITWHINSTPFDLQCFQ